MEDMDVDNVSLDYLKNDREVSNLYFGKVEYSPYHLREVSKSSIFEIPNV